MSALTSLRDPARLAALASTGLLDAAPDEALGRLVGVLTRALQAPVGLVSLVDDSRQFFCAQLGLPEPLAAEQQIPLSHSLCQYVVSDGTPLIVDDAREDPHLSGHGAVTDLDVVAYLGAPLCVDGHVVGSLSVTDFVARRWTVEDVAVVVDLAAVASDSLVLRGRSADALTVAAVEQSVLASLPDTAVMQRRARL